MHTIIQGDCLTVLPTLADNTFQSLVTDPPAGISFMGKEWDSNKGGRVQWVSWLTSVMLECNRVLCPGSHAFVWALPRTAHRTTTAIEEAGFEIRDIVTHLFTGFPKSLNLGDGWGTALKPACEFWILARKTLSEKTIAENVKRWGAGGINIDGCRVPIDPNERQIIDNRSGAGFGKVYPIGRTMGQFKSNELGRFPANLICSDPDLLGDPARFFYCPKISRAERGEENNHPTVKPLTLMRYLVRMITPTGGTVLDPFMGSGSTGLAAAQEGFAFVGIEQSPEYCTIAEARLKH